MTTTVSSSRTAAALAARRTSAQAAVERVRQAVARLRRDGVPVTVAAVARRANVSRTFLYTNTDARTAIADTCGKEDQRAGRQEATESPWRERALNAEDALKTAHAEILNQRTRIGELLGQIRDLEAEWTQESVQRVTTENTTLKQRVRQLTQDNRTLEERLSAARSALRFQDRRLADLEAQLTDAHTRYCEGDRPCPPDNPAHEIQLPGATRLPI